MDPSCTDPSISDLSLSSVSSLLTSLLQDFPSLSSSELGPIPIIQASNLTPSHFTEHHLAKNSPLLILNATRGWNAARDFVRPDGSVDATAFLAGGFGGCPVRVTDTSSAQGGYGEGTVLEMTLESFLQSWPSRGAPLLYLKDWHWVADCRAGVGAGDKGPYVPYETPEVFQEDWLNWYYDELQATNTEPSPTSQAAAQTAAGAGPGQASPSMTSDYRFCYLGPRGTWTPLHCDVLKSYSWSANVAGRKRWWLLHPRFAWMVYDRTLRELAPSLHPSAPPAPSDPWPVPPDAHSAAAAFSSGSHPTPTLTELVEDARRKMVDPACRFPWLSLAAALAVPVEQPAGSALFVPSGWTHMVLNTEDTLSLNHNWVNGFNAGTWAARLLLREYRVAYDLLEDCRNLMPTPALLELVEANVEANCGFSLRNFGARGLLGKVAARAGGGGPESASTAADSMGPPAHEAKLGMTCISDALRLDQVRAALSVLATLGAAGLADVSAEAELLASLGPGAAAAAP